MKEYYLTFVYDERGFGQLQLHNDSLIPLEYRCRTGSINRDGELVRAIEPGPWWVVGNPAWTTEEAMTITPGKGWKVRMYREIDGSMIYHGFLIHPDGNVPGTLGCLGIQNDDALILKERIEQILKRQNKIQVVVTRCDFYGQSNIAVQGTENEVREISA